VAILLLFCGCAFILCMASLTTPFTSRRAATFMALGAEAVIALFALLLALHPAVAIVWRIMPIQLGGSSYDADMTSHVDCAGGL
jgi:NAD/NADP transhydrogenase beta subunit